MDIDELDQLLLDDYDGFNSTDNQRDKETDTFDPLAPSSPSARNAPPIANKRRQLKKLDADLLLSEKGLPRLRHEAPLIRFHGKGHEDTDLRKLMDYYQMWAHALYPRLQFRDFARNVMKATANPRVKVKLQEWQDEHREKTDELARMAREQDGEEELDDGQEKQNSDDDDNQDSDEDMNDIFMDYLVGVKSGAIPITDAPTEIEQNQQTGNGNARDSRPAQDYNQDDSDDDDLFFNTVTGGDPKPTPMPMDIQPLSPPETAPATLAKAASDISGVEDVSSEDGDDEPLFINRRPRRIAADEDEDMSE